jgi:hypothetical protein
MQKNSQNLNQKTSSPTLRNPKTRYPSPTLRNPKTRYPSPTLRNTIIISKMIKGSNQVVFLKALTLLPSSPLISRLWIRINLEILEI